MITETLKITRPVDLAGWLKQPSPRYTLAIGGTCGCDVSRLGQRISDHLNRRFISSGRSRFLSFDREDIRLLAGDPFWRNSILAVAPDHATDAPPRCDYETMIRGIASIGDAVLSGQYALEATAGLDRVYRVALAHHPADGTDSNHRVDPDGFGDEALAESIARKFIQWCGESAPDERMRDLARDLGR